MTALMAVSVHASTSQELSGAVGGGAGLRTRNLDVKALQAIFELLQAHYPERLAALWFLNAPFLFWGIWRLVRARAGVWPLSYFESPFHQRHHAWCIASPMP